MTIDEALAQAKKATRQRRFADAAAIYKSILQQQPGHAIAKKALRKLERSGQPLSDEPQSAELEKLVKRLNTGDFAAVVKDCQQKLKAFPRSILLKNLLGTALQRSGDAEKALAIFDELIALKPGFVEAYINKGIALRDLGQLEQARSAYEKAVNLNPNHATAQLNLANICKDFGDFEQAIKGYEATIALAPEFPQAHRNLAQLKSWQAEDPHRKQLQRLWQKQTGSAKAEIGFALAHAEEALGNYEQCFTYLKEANQLKKTELGYVINEDEKLFERIKSCSPARLALELSNTSSQRPIFIVGMMRSGTSLLEQILASHSNVYGAGELEALNRRVLPVVSSNKSNGYTQEDVLQLRHGYLKALQALNVSEPVITDKMPLNFRWLGYALEAFPEAKVLHIKRDPMAVAWSIYKHYFVDSGNAYAWDLEDIASYTLLYEGLMQHWQTNYGDRILDVPYEKLTREQESMTREILAFCELDWEPACMEFHKTKRTVTTVSASQVRQGMYQGSSEAWKNFEPWLGDLLLTLKSPQPIESETLK